MEFRYAYLHGFASSSKSSKGQLFSRRFAARGEVLELPELNRPDFARLTISGALEAIDEMAAAAPEARWRLIGSSMGGWLAALWAEANPARVERLALLCPGFDLASRWPEMIGEEAMQTWRREGSMLWPDGAGVPTPVHWGFVEDAAQHAPRPAPACPILVLHGRQDETVPIEGSRDYVAAHPNARLVEFDDDHRLLSSAEAIFTQIEGFFWGDVATQ